MAVAVQGFYERSGQGSFPFFANRLAGVRRLRRLHGHGANAGENAVDLQFCR